MKKWNDQPYYARANDDTGTKSENKLQTNQNTTFAGYQKRGLKPSANMIWFLEEDRKRARKEPNEHDYHEIKAALAGFRNNWSHVVQSHPNLFDKKFSQLDWKHIFELKERLK